MVKIVDARGARAQRGAERPEALGQQALERAAALHPGGRRGQAQHGLGGGAAIVASEVAAAGAQVPGAAVGRDGQGGEGGRLAAGGPADAHLVETVAADAGGGRAFGRHVRDGIEGHGGDGRAHPHRFGLGRDEAPELLGAFGGGDRGAELQIEAAAALPVVGPERHAAVGVAAARGHERFEQAGVADAGPTAAGFGGPVAANKADRHRRRPRHSAPRRRRARGWGAGGRGVRAAAGIDDFSPLGQGASRGLPAGPLGPQGARPGRLGLIRPAVRGAAGRGGERRGAAGRGGARRGAAGRGGARRGAAGRDKCAAGLFLGPAAAGVRYFSGVGRRFGRRPRAA